MSWLNTFIFEATGKDAFIYLSLTALSLTIRLGKTEAKPGIRLSIQINSFSIQLRSWLLQTEMMKTVCRRKEKKGSQNTLSIMILTPGIQLPLKRQQKLPHSHNL